MITKTLIGLVLSAVLISPVAARVQSDPIGGLLKTNSGVSNPPTGSGTTSAQRQSPDLKKSNREEIKSLRNATQEEIQASREAMKSAVEQKREEFKNVLETMQSEAKVKIEAKQAELKNKLAKIKDERKKQIVENVSTNLNQLNADRLKYFSAVLEKLDSIVLKISSRADKAEGNGADVALTRTALTEAKNAIAVSRGAIETQSGKVYSIAITTESALKINVGAARKSLHADLTKVQETVKAAREAVRKAIETLMKVPRVDSDEPNPAPAPTSTSVQ